MLNFTSGVKPTGKPESLTIFNKLELIFTGISLPRPVDTETPDEFRLSYTIHHFASSGNENLEAWYIAAERPKGVVLMFHGYGSCKSALLSEARALHELGYSTFLIDFRGSGGSSGNRTTIGYFEADDVKAAFEYVRMLAPDQPFVLYGQSMGSAAILRAINVYGVKPSAIIIEGVYDRMLTTVKNRFRLMGYPSFPFAHLLVFWGSVQCGFNAFRLNPVDYAASVDCPALVMHGAVDHRATIEEAQSVYSNLRGPKEFKQFEGLSHQSYYYARPDEWNAAVSGFLDKYL